MVRVNVCARGHRIYDIDCGSCRVLNPNPRRRPSGLRRRHLGPVAERDRHQCQLCGEPVDLTLTPPHPQSATLDHVIPRAHGGSDHRDNLQLAHLDCNEAKADMLLTALGRDVQFLLRPGSW
jgi:5-methylcytosine-specific restriction endonuclease McrA